MIDHVSVPVRDLAGAAAFYERVLEPLGYARLVTRPQTIGFGKKYPELWLNLRTDLAPAPANPVALAAGGTSAGAPGLRQTAMTTYFGAFILDPDGNKLEALSFPKPAG